jgi:hypothetical protein
MLRDLMIQTSSLDFLNQLSDDLVERITYLENVNHRHERILRYLALCKIKETIVCIESPESGHHDVQNNDTDISKESSDFHDVDVASSPSALDSVLLLAREIREKKANKKLGTVIKNPTNTAELQKSSTNKLASKSNVKGTVDTKGFVADSKNRLQNSKEKIDRQRKSSINARIPDYHISIPVIEGNHRNNTEFITLRDHLFAQLDVLKRRKKDYHQFDSYDKDKELYYCQHRVLSHLNGRPTFPHSIAYSALNHEHILQEINPHNSDQNDALESINSIRFEEDQEIIHETDENEKNREFLMQNLKANREDYNRHLKARLNRTPISKLETNDLKEIFTTWYKTQKCLESYEDSGYLNENKPLNDRDSNSKDLRNRARHTYEEDTDMQRLQQLKIDMIDSMPLNISDDMTINDDVLMSKEWFRNAINVIELHHENFGGRLKFVIESAIGRYELRNTVKKLKECCALEKEFRVTTTNKNKNNKDGWIEALKYYKAVHCCLTTEAQDFSSCIFISKDK